MIQAFVLVLGVAAVGIAVGITMKRGL